MANWNYQAIDKLGKKSNGQINAESMQQARQKLKDEGLFARKITLVNEKSSSFSNLLQFGKGVSTDQLSLFTRQLATLVAAAIPIGEALDTLIKQTEKAKMRQIISQVRARLVEGYSFADSLKKFPNIFDNIYVALVSSGEKSGKLDQVLERLADYMEQQLAQKQKAKNSMIYPVILIFVAAGIVIALMNFVVPKLAEQFTHSKQELPTITKALIAMSEFLQSYTFLMIGLIFVAILIFRFMLRKDDFRMKWHKLKLKMPFFGGLFLLLDTSRLARTLSIVVSSGIPLLEGLKISEQTLSNDFLRLAVTNATNQVKQGVSLYKALENTNLFPPLMLHMVASGEKSGTLEEMLAKVAESLDKSFAQKVEMTVSLFEPMMILVMGGVILVIVLAILLPIMQLNDTSGF